MSRTFLVNAIIYYVHLQQSTGNYFTTLVTANFRSSL